MTAAPQFRQGDAEWDRLRARSLADLYWFAGNVLGYGDRIPMRKGPHALLCKFIERKTGVPQLDTARYRKIEMPRETGKTTLSIARIIQRICADPNCSILLANEKEQNARDFLAEIKHQFESNEFLRGLFPEVIPPDLNDTTWSASRIIVNRSTGRKEPTVSVIGVGGTVTGMHYTAIICDDVISREAMENARAGSRQIMEQVNRWIHQLEPLLDSNAEPFPEIIFIGTRWWESDSYEHIEEAFGYGEPKQPFLLKLKLENGEIQHVVAWRRGDLAIFRRAAIEDNRSIFPEKWDLDRLAKIRVRDPALFAANYMNDPSDDQTSTFKADWLHYYDWLDDKTVRFTDGAAVKRTYGLADLDILILVDPGGFAVRQIEDRANAAIVVTGSTPKGEHLILEADSEKDTFLGCIRKVLDKVTRYNPRRVFVEVAGQQIAFVELLRQNAQQANLAMSLDVVKPGTQHKEVRILTLEPYFQRGQIFIGRSAAFTQFQSQYAKFPRAARLDLLDALGYGPQVWRKQSTNRLNPTQRQQQELDAYYQKRGLSRR
jgi:hypothetical protein